MVPSNMPYEHPDGYPLPCMQQPHSVHWFSRRSCSNSSSPSNKLSGENTPTTAPEKTLPMAMLPAFFIPDFAI